MVRPWRHFTWISKAKRLSAGAMRSALSFQGQLAYIFPSKTGSCLFFFFFNISWAKVVQVTGEISFAHQVLVASCENVKNGLKAALLAMLIECQGRESSFLANEIKSYPCVYGLNVFLVPKFLCGNPNFYYDGWRRKWQPAPVFLPRESCGQRSLVGCCPGGCMKSDTTEAT